MPLVGAGHSLNLIGDEAPYFTSLEEFDSWIDKPSRKMRSVLRYTPRSRTVSPPQRGKLLVRPISRNTRSRHSHSIGLSRLQGKHTSPFPIVFGCKPSTRGDIPRNLRHSRTPSTSGHSVRPLSSMCYVGDNWCDVHDPASSFAHNRITIPPSGWITAAHRQGVKMLGTMWVLA